MYLYIGLLKANVSIWCDIQTERHTYIEHHDWNDLSILLSLKSKKRTFGKEGRKNTPTIKSLIKVFV